MGKQREGGSMTNGGRHKKRKKEERGQRRRKGSRMETPRKKELKILPSFFFCLPLKKDTFWRNFSLNFTGGDGKSSRISCLMSLCFSSQGLFAARPY